MLNDADVRQSLRRRTEQSSITFVARELQVSQALLSMVLDGSRGLSPALLKKLGYRRVLRYERTGLRAK